jgi:hypothetical protein
MNLTRHGKPVHRRGAALLLCLFALLLVSALGMLMVVESSTEKRVNANYGSSLSAYYAARSGLEEVRDRMNYPSSPSPPSPSPPDGGLADLLPQDIAGTAGGVLYVLNPNNGEVVDPTDPGSLYFDDQLCHDYDSGTVPGSKCATIPATSGWAAIHAAMTPKSGPLGYKWVRVNMKTNRIAAPYYVDRTDDTAPLDTRVCWDGQTEQLSPAGTRPNCDANGMQNVYMLTALGVTSGIGEARARRMLRFEVVAPAIRPAAAVTVSGPGSTLSPAPVFSGGGIPATAIDGRVHNLDGSLSGGNRCSSVAAVATDSNRMTRELEKALNALRLSIVEEANASCNADGSSVGDANCTYGLWWVRGTDPEPQFVTTSPVPVPTPVPIPRHRHGHHGSGNGDSTGTISSTTTCTAATPNCYTNLNLAAPQLMALAASDAAAPNASAPFIGNPGNQSDAALYQPASQRVLADEIAALGALASASADQENYFSVTSGNLQTSYGSPDNPAIVVIADSSLKLQSTPLSGYGLLVVTNDLEINNTLRWTGIVLVQSTNGQNGQLVIAAGGSINGALFLQSGSSLNLQTSTSASPFRITYSCDAIDLAFQSLPFKIVASSEVTY